ncbi:hypothetical protein SEA_BLINN1_75 [Mycobacterium phage Blinn1]|uniref:Gp68-like predicted RNA polymerase component domain-containing protein n=1 Tax=Mycobacterium phage Blinn1 TaxID=2656562 RepID=A0A649VS59_9CAUD|nr:hypothetical protein KIP53_gp034 [Mycobacterium phage Blinn1]QGJ94835.1 hypothetical protein SEA_BLINN1_75 [Mycobacterium phage Blinn1]
MQLANDWNPNDPILKSPYAPHETGGVLRIHRSGYRGSQVMKILKLRGTKLMKQMQKALDDETRASAQGRPIHDAAIDPKLAM